MRLAINGKLSHWNAIVNGTLDATAPVENPSLPSPDCGHFISVFWHCLEWFCFYTITVLVLLTITTSCSICRSCSSESVRISPKYITMEHNHSIGCYHFHAPLFYHKQFTQIARSFHRAVSCKILGRGAFIACRSNRVVGGGETNE
jgi:hypothetical protein